MKDAKMLIIGIFIGCVIGYAYAHHIVATECKRLGKFYVGDETFECVKISETVEEPES